jgi:dihydroorotate dehydrogenase subfamily 1
MKEASLNLAGIPLKNRVIIAAGCHGADGETIVRASKTGVAAIVTKTIVANAVEDVRPCFTLVDGGFINSVFGTTLSAKQWFDVELPKAKEAGIPIIASLAGLHPAEAASLAKQAVAAGADMIEMPTVCPHMGEILQAMFPGLTMPPPEVHDVAPYVATIHAVKDAVTVPVISKFSALFHANVVEWAIAAEEAGIDAIACADAFGPALKIDIETGEPALGGPRGVGGLTGSALKPISLRMILEMAQHVKIPLIGVGGISRAEDAIEYFMAGASFVGVVTAGHLRGTHQFERIITGIDKWVADHGYFDVQDFIGLTLKRIASRKERGLVTITTPQPPVIDPNLCTGCNRCVVSCVYDALFLGDDHKVHLIPEKCYGCGLCRYACNFNAIHLTYFD